MSSEILGGAENLLKGNLGGAWDIKHGYADAYTDLGVARRFGGAEAAYSLRDVGAMNGPVVNVRREPHDDDDPGVADETDFSASQVQSGALEDWVNGKLETTLPADVATASGAYSLRKVKLAYSGNAVRIRRIDNTEVDVAFDSDGKVSTNSSITNVLSGDVDNTNETTLGNFLQGEADVRALFNNASYNPTASTSSNNYWRANPEIDLGTGAFTWSCDFILTGGYDQNLSRIMQTFDSASYWYWESSTRLRYQIAGSASGTTFLPSSTPIQLGRKYNMEFSRDASNNTTLKIDGVVVGTNNTTDRNSGQVDVGRLAGFRLAGSAFNFNFNNGQHIYAGDGVETSNWVDTGTGGKNLSKEGSPVAFTGQGINSLVHTWYDQAGSNNAVQANAGSQPKIAEDGALLDGIKFDADADGGSPKYLETTSKLGDSTDFFAATVIGEVQGQDAFGGIVTSRSAADEGFAFGLNSSEKSQAFIYSSGGNTNAISDEVIGTTKTLLSLDKDSTAINGNVNAIGAFTFTSNTMGSITEDKSYIGVGGRTDTTPTTLGLRANINELVFYNSDQASNKFLIESNINNYYGLYNDEFELKGEAKPASAVIINGVNYGNGDTVTGLSKNSFEYTLNDQETGNRFMRYMIDPNSYITQLTNGEKVYMSFNITIPTGLSVFPQLRSGFTTLATSSSFSGSGFKTITFTRNSTSGTIDNLMLQTIGVGNATVRLENIKISRMSRNGFVETWYDQSGNGNNATQGTAKNQPSIVLNGGIYKDTNDLPSVKFTTTSTVSGEGRFIEFTKINFGGTLSFFAKHFIRRPSAGGNGRQYSEDGGATGGNKSIIILDISQYNFFSGGSNLISGTGIQDANNIQTFLLNNQNKLNIFTNGTANSNNEITLSNTIADFELGRMGSPSESTSSFSVDMDVSELILYSTDLSSDRTEIEQDMKTFYNI